MVRCPTAPLCSGIRCVDAVRVCHISAARVRVAVTQEAAGTARWVVTKKCPVSAGRAFVGGGTVVPAAQHQGFSAVWYVLKSKDETGTVPPFIEKGAPTARSHRPVPAPHALDAGRCSCLLRGVRTSGAGLWHPRTLSILGTVSEMHCLRGWHNRGAGGGVWHPSRGAAPTCPESPGWRDLRQIERDAAKAPVL